MANTYTSIVYQHMLKEFDEFQERVAYYTDLAKSNETMLDYVIKELVSKAF